MQAATLGYLRLPKDVVAKVMAERQAIINAGGEVIVWHYRDNLEELIRSRGDIFRKVRE